MEINNRWKIKLVKNLIFSEASKLNFHRMAGKFIKNLNEIYYYFHSTYMAFRITFFDNIFCIDVLLCLQPKGDSKLFEKSQITKV